MATKKREIGVVKEKKASPSQTTTTTKTPLRGTLNQSTKTSVSSPSSSSSLPKKVPTSLIKPTTTSLIKPTTTRSTATNASKQQGKKPASTETPQKPTVARTIKPVSPMQKTRVPTSASTQSSPLSGKPVDSQKPVPGKNLKTTSKDAGKSRLDASNVKKSSTGVKKEVESGTSSATKEHVTCILKVETPSVVEAEEEAQDQEESCIDGVMGEKVDGEKGTDDHLVVEDQEPLDIAKKSEAEIDDDTDVKVVVSEPSTDSGNENIVPDVKRRDSDDKSANVQVLEEHDKNSHEEDVREVEQVAKEVVEEKTEMDSAKEADEIKETERKEEVVVKKQEPAENKGPKQVERAHGKKDTALSNDVIEETASKLQEQRKNRVRALAGAFETVISLQEK